jgi:hypothetical protein
MDRVRSWLDRKAGELRSLPIVRDLWARISPQVTAPGRRDELLDYFLSGHSIARSAAQANPGAHGEIIVIQQRQLENAARNYILQLEADLLDLKQASAQATGHAATRAQRLDQQIAQLERENQALRRALAAARQIAAQPAGGVR